MAKKNKERVNPEGEAGNIEVKQSLLDRIKELGEKLSALKADEARTEALGKHITRLTTEAKRLSVDDSKFVEKADALTAKIEKFKPNLESLSGDVAQVTVEAEASGTEAPAADAEILAVEPMPAAVEPENAEVLAPAEAVAAAKSEAGEKNAREEHQVVVNAKFGMLMEAMKMADKKLAQDQKNLIKFGSVLKKLRGITTEMTMSKNESAFARHLTDFNTKFEEILGNIDPEVRKIYESRTKKLPQPEAFAAQTENPVEPAATAPVPAEAGPSPEKAKEIEELKKRFKENGKQVNAQIIEANRLGVIDQFKKIFQGRAQELVDRINNAKVDELTPLIIEYDELIKEMVGSINALVEEKNKAVAPEAAAPEVAAAPEPASDIQAEMHAERKRCSKILNEKIHEFNDLSGFAQDNGVDEKFDQFVAEGDYFIDEMEKNSGKEFDKIAERFDKWMAGIKKDVDIRIKEKKEAEAAVVAAAAVPEPAAVPPAEATPPEKKGIFGWIKEKFSGAKEYAKIAVSPDGRKAIAANGYRTITKIFGVKIFTDALLAIKKQGDLYEYIKGVSGTKADKKAVGDIVKEMIAIMEEEERKKGEAETPEEADEAHVESERVLGQKAEELRKKIEDAKYISASEKRELGDKLMEIIKTRDANVDEAKIKRDKKIQEALSAYVVNKVSGYRIASDALDVLLVSLPTLRPLVYGGMAAAERAQKAGRKASKEAGTESRAGKELSVLKDITVNAAKETYRGLTFKGIEGKADATKKEKALGFVKAFGTVARGLGIIGLGLGAGRSTQQSIDNLLGAFEKGVGTGTIQIAKGFSDNLERMLHPLDTASNAVRRVKGALGFEQAPSPTGEVLRYKLKGPSAERLAQANAAVAAAEAMPVPARAMPEMPGTKFHIKEMGSMSDGAEISAPSRALRNLESYFKQRGVKWEHKEIVAEEQAEGFKFNKDGSRDHPFIPQKVEVIDLKTGERRFVNGSKYVPWIDENNRGHAALVDLTKDPNWGKGEFRMVHPKQRGVTLETFHEPARTPKIEAPAPGVAETSDISTDTKGFMHVKVGNGEIVIDPNQGIENFTATEIPKGNVRRIVPNYDELRGIWRNSVDGGDPRILRQKIRAIEPFYDALQKLNEAGKGGSLEASRLTETILNTTKQQGWSWENYVNWPGGPVGKAVDLGAASSRVIEPDWSGKAGGGRSYAFTESGQPIDVKQAAVKIMEPNWGLESGGAGAKPKIWSAAEFEKLSQSAKGGAKVTGAALRAEARPTIETPEPEKIADNRAERQAAEIEKLHLESLPELRRNWNEIFGAYYEKDKGGVVGGLLQKISTEMNVNPRMNNEISDILNDRVSMTSSGGKLNKIIDIYAGSHPLSPEESILIGDEYVTDTEKFDIIKMEDGIQAVVARGPGSHAVRLIYPAGNWEFQSNKFAKFIIDENGELEVVKAAG